MARAGSLDFSMEEEYETPIPEVIYLQGLFPPDLLILPLKL